MLKKRKVSEINRNLLINVLRARPAIVFSAFFAQNTINKCRCLDVKINYCSIFQFLEKKVYFSHIINYDTISSISFFEIT